VSAITLPSTASVANDKAGKMSKSSEKISTLSDKAWLMREASRITSALGETFAPLCEVVLHDLTDPEHAIAQIENNLSGRAVGDSATELGLARIVDPDFPEVIANYANAFADGRPVKSTSIGLKDKTGKFIAAICINVDISYLNSFGGYLSALTRITSPEQIAENLSKSAAVADVSAKILAYAAKRNRDPRALTKRERTEILEQLVNEGELERRGAAERIAGIIGISRSNIYYYVKKAKKATPGHASTRAPTRQVRRRRRAR
jgi:predicted transcriptional regulator YheO